MSYRLSQVIFFIYLIVVVVLWYQNVSFFPNIQSAENTVVAPDKENRISITDARKISTLKLDFSLFDDPIYKSLNFRSIPVTELKDIPKGRANPFTQ